MVSVLNIFPHLEQWTFLHEAKQPELSCHFFASGTIFSLWSMLELQIKCHFIYFFMPWILTHHLWIIYLIYWIHWISRSSSQTLLSSYPKLSSPKFCSVAATLARRQMLMKSCICLILRESINSLKRKYSQYSAPTDSDAVIERTLNEVAKEGCQFLLDEVFLDLEVRTSAPWPRSSGGQSSAVIGWVLFTQGFSPDQKLQGFNFDLTAALELTVWTVLCFKFPLK